MKKGSISKNFYVLIKGNTYKNIPGKLNIEL